MRAILQIQPPLQLMSPIRVSINGNDRTLDQVTPSWLKEQIEGRRASGQVVCVKVQIMSGSLNVALSTPGCAGDGGGGGGRRPTPSEQAIFDLWEKRGLNDNDFLVGQLNAFLSQIKNMV